MKFQQAGGSGRGRARAAQGGLSSLREAASAPREVLAAGASGPAQGGGPRAALPSVGAEDRAARGDEGTQGPGGQAHPKRRGGSAGGGGAPQSGPLGRGPPRRRSARAATLVEGRGHGAKDLRWQSWHASPAALTIYRHCFACPRPCPHSCRNYCESTLIFFQLVLNFSPVVPRNSISICFNSFPNF